MFRCLNARARFWRSLTGTARSFASSSRCINKVLIANRGEIACRTIRTARKNGIQTVAVYSEPDAQAPYVKMADEAFPLAGTTSAETYLDMDAIIDVAQTAGADAVFPGYGFLSENAEFVNKLEEAGVLFLGPGSHAISQMGDKIVSKRVAAEAGVHVVPGFQGTIDSHEQLLSEAHSIGYPVIVKAVHGGGGKGMRWAHNDEELIEGFELSRQESVSAFGSDEMLVEKLITNARHVEMQVLADKHGNAVWVNERDCSMQRRNQKVLEEAPAAQLPQNVREEMGRQACELALAVDYVGAGTVEFLVDSDTHDFYFLEMNTRLQVEHGVTEEVSGLDLVDEIMKVCCGEPLSFTQEEVKCDGWSIEARVYAEDATKDFLPSIGTLTRYVEPTGQGIRVDSGVVEGSKISVHYDPMIAKLIATGPDRAEALQRLRDALDSYVIEGVTSNIDFLRALCDHPAFVDGTATTGLIEAQYPSGFEPEPLSDGEHRALIAAAMVLKSDVLWQQLSISDQIQSFDAQEFHRHNMQELVASFDAVSADGESIRRHINVQLESVLEHDNHKRFALALDGEERITVDSSYQQGDTVFSVVVNDRAYTLQALQAAGHSPEFGMLFKGTPHYVQLLTPTEFRYRGFMPVSEVADTSKMLLSPMPGCVVSVDVKPGDEVVPGQVVMVVEAMKMQNGLQAERAGVVKSVKCAPGDSVEDGDLLIEYK